MRLRDDGQIRIRLASIIVASWLVGAGSASAQYFGANKVQFRAQDFQVLQTPHFDIYFHQHDRATIDLAARIAERWWARLADFFGTEPSGRQPLILYGSHTDFEQTQITPDLIDPGTGGFTEPERRRIVLPLAGPLADTDHVIGHELVHAFQFDIESRRDRKGGSALERMPLWFIEGLAEYLSLGPLDNHTAMWMRDAVLRDDVPNVWTLNNGRYFPYRWGHAFWAYVAGRWGPRAAAELFAVGVDLGIPIAIQRVLQISARDFSTHWRAALVAAYSVSEPPDPPGRLLINGNEFTSLNVGPAVSPNGRWLAFLSSRGYFSVDLYVADAGTGTVVQRLTDLAADTHYSALPFIDSAAAWDPEGTRLVVATMTSGRATLTAFAWPGGKRVFDAVIHDVDELGNPTWSPDGRTIVFSGLRNGVLDLFAYDIEHHVVRELTHDPYAELDPAWSPDGKRIAFATDRFTTNLDSLTFGGYRLAVLDIATGAVTEISTGLGGRQLRPQWVRDGVLTFVADADGIANLYRFTLADGILERETRVTTGVSGITATSPSLSVAASAAVAVFTVFDDAGYAIRTMALDEGERVDVDRVSAPLRLPPLEPDDGTAPWSAEKDASPTWQPAAAPSTQYRGRLKLDRVMQANVGVGVNRFGGTAGTGIGVAFSDMLNTRVLVAGGQIQQSLGGGIGLRDSAGYLVYANQSRRWPWGVIGSYVPAYVGADWTSNGPLLPQTVSVLRQTDLAMTAFTAYPLSRARRIEFQAGADRLSFDRMTFDLEGDITTTMAAPAITVATSAVAFVSDTSSPGGASMVRGMRYRFEAAPVMGSLQYVSLLADVRRYFMPVPFYTIAVRGLHAGRYGHSADDPRLPPFFLGYPTLVRGYNLAYVEATCVRALASGCDDASMVGSRLAVGNIELRFPLLRPFGVSRGMYGPVPVEVGLFADGGVAWRGGEVPWRMDGNRVPVWSAGVTVRTSVIGFGLGQFDIVRRFPPAADGWSFQFNLAPAF